MAGKKDKVKAALADGHSADLKLDTTSVTTLENDPLPTVHISKSNLAEIKGALDEAVKKVRLGFVLRALRAVLPSRI